jgi:hypothetical protein
MLPSYEEPSRSPLPEPEDPVRISSVLGVITILFAAVMILVLAAEVPSSRWPCIAATVAPLFAGGIFVLRGRHTMLAVGVLGLAAVLGIAGYWFVPTTTGISRWSAEQSVAELETLPVGNARDFEQRWRRAEEAVSEFGDLKTRADAALVRWMGQTAKAALTEVAGLKPDNRLSEGVARLDDLRDVFEKVKPTEVSSRREVANIQRVLAQARLDVAQKELDVLTDGDQLDGEISALVDRLRRNLGGNVDKDDLEKLLRACGRRAVRGDFRLVERLLEESQGLREQKKPDAADKSLDAALRRLREIPDRHKDLLPVVKSVDQMPEYEECLRRVMHARLKAAGERRALLQEQKNYPDIEKLAQQVDAEWRFAPPGVRSEVEQFVEDCIVVCVNAEIKKADTLVEAGQLDAASACLKTERAKRVAELQREQTRPEEKRPVTESLRKAQRHLAQAGLDGYRKRFVALVAEEKYDKVERLRKEIDKENWRDDARAGGIDDKVQAFVSGCDFVLAVARSAGKLPAAQAKP